MNGPLLETIEFQFGEKNLVSENLIISIQTQAKVAVEHTNPAYKMVSGLFVLSKHWLEIGRPLMVLL